MEKNGIGQKAAAAGRYARNMWKWLAAAVVIGALCGASGALFHRAIDAAAQTRLQHPWLIWLLPVGGVATLLLYRLCRVSFDVGTDSVIASVNAGSPVPLPLAPLIVAGTVLSHLFGASVGREGAALQLGGAIGYHLGRAAGFDAEDARLTTLCGMAGCFSAMFGAPLTAAAFALEVASAVPARRRASLSCLAAATAAHLAALALGAEPMRFPLGAEIPALGAGSVARTAVLAALCALVGAALCLSLEGGRRLARKYLKNPYVRIGAGGAVMAAATSLLGLYDYAGAGTQVIARAVEGQAAPWAFLWKLLLTALCAAAGFRGGEIVPALFVGAAFGCRMAPLLGLTPGFGAAVGMIALFCSAVNCPFASLFLALELFATRDLVLFAVAVAASFALSGPFSLYESHPPQRGGVEGARSDHI